eukprot:gnl/MRDRNA2_/MRDRNA2_92165_c0_seq1.p1 gnl/MRDRNA2_/MRDRNA2_92165_c0~~gnl/MRDRNA2_/MRDRNA2_92165_c0_seq1.p1  ORF type:complete len:828 (+),score=257.31 gnl/MRDRNA2_/MRDRNA2_92165_c0_seq1:318-2486(+)
MSGTPPGLDAALELVEQEVRIVHKWASEEGRKVQETAKEEVAQLRLKAQQEATEILAHAEVEASTLLEELHHALLMSLKEDTAFEVSQEQIVEEEAKNSEVKSRLNKVEMKLGAQQRRTVDLQRQLGESEYNLEDLQGRMADLSNRHVSVLRRQRARGQRWEKLEKQQWEERQEKEALKAKGLLSEADLQQMQQRKHERAALKLALDVQSTRHARRQLESEQQEDLQAAVQHAEAWAKHAALNNAFEVENSIAVLEAEAEALQHSRDSLRTLLASEGGQLSQLEAAASSEQEVADKIQSEGAQRAFAEAQQFQQERAMMLTNRKKMELDLMEVIRATEAQNSELENEAEKLLQERNVAEQVTAMEAQEGRQKLESDAILRNHLESRFGSEMHALAKTLEESQLAIREEVLCDRDSAEHELVAMQREADVESKQFQLITHNSRANLASRKKKQNAELAELRRRLLRASSKQAMTKQMISDTEVEVENLKRESQRKWQVEADLLRQREDLAVYTQMAAEKNLKIVNYNNQLMNDIKEKRQVCQLLRLREDEVEKEVLDQEQAVSRGRSSLETSENAEAEARSALEETLNQNQQLQTEQALHLEQVERGLKDMTECAALKAEVAELEGQLQMLLGPRKSRPTAEPLAAFNAAPSSGSLSTAPGSSTPGRLSRSHSGGHAGAAGGRNAPTPSSVKRAGHVWSASNSTGPASQSQKVISWLRKKGPC